MHTKFSGVKSSSNLVKLVFHLYDIHHYYICIITQFLGNIFLTLIICQDNYNYDQFPYAQATTVITFDVVRNSSTATTRIDKNPSIMQHKCAVHVNATAIIRQKNPTKRTNGTEASRHTTNTTSCRSGTVSVTTNRGGSLNSVTSERNRNARIRVGLSGDNEVITMGNGTIFTDEYVSNMNIKFDLILHVIRDQLRHDTPSTMTNFATTCDCVDIKWILLSTINTVDTTTLNFIISRVGLREQLVLKGVFDIFYGANNICECKCGFNGNSYNNGYYYPTPFTTPTPMNFNVTRDEVSRNNVLGLIFGVIDNQIIILMILLLKKKWYIFFEKTFSLSQHFLFVIPFELVNLDHLNL